MSKKLPKEFYLKLPSENSTPSQRHNTHQLISFSEVKGMDEHTIEKAKEYVLQHWWEDLCRSGNTSCFRHCLFEEQWFDRYGVLDANEREFRWIVKSLCFLYVHMKKQYGEEELKAWTVKWIVDRKDRALIQARSAVDGQELRMAPPLGGWIFDAGSVGAQRKIRQKEEQEEVALALTKPSLIWKPKSSSIFSKAIANTADNKAKMASDSKADDTVELNDVVEISIWRTKKATRSETEESRIDNEDWALVEEDEFDDI